MKVPTSVRAAYRDNYARLAQIKARYDPGNLSTSIRISSRPGDAFSTPLLKGGWVFEQSFEEEEAEGDER